MDYNNQNTTIKSSVSQTIIDQGLRAYMLKVYNYMASGVALTGFIALLLFKLAVVSGPNGEILGLTQIGNAIYNSALMWVLMLAPLGCLLYTSPSPRDKRQSRMPSSA